MRTLLDEGDRHTAPAPAALVERRMPTCPTCFTSYPADATTCAVDGAALVPDETFAHVDKGLSEGTVVGEYRIDAKLGEGGFGAVYRAVHPLIGKMAAVKVLGREFSANPQMVSRFVAEARAVNQIRHRNIIDIFSFGQLPDGRQYYIMELLEGETFDAYLARRRRLSLLEAMPILRGIARALDAAHGKDILHRDLKPENVFLVFDEEGRVEPKLLDFGLVKLRTDTTSHKTKTGTPMGTPYYMSPEQSRGLEVDARTDVYSFGVLVFEVLTGELPFDGQSAMDILFKHMTEPPPKASQRCPEVPVAVDEVLARLMAKDPNDRPARAGEALERLAAAGGVELPAVGPITPRGAPSAVDLDRAIARTVMAEAPPSSAIRLDQAAARTPPVGETFLGAERDAPASRARPRALVAGAVIAVAAATGGALLLLGRETTTVSAGGAQASAAPAAASAPSASASPIASAAPIASASPTSAEVDITTTGAPDGTIVSIDGVKVGPAPGPFKVKQGAPITLTLAAKGYHTMELAITPTESVLLPVSLEKVAKAPGARPAGGKALHSDLESFDDKK